MPNEPCNSRKTHPKMKRPSRGERKLLLHGDIILRFTIRELEDFILRITMSEIGYFILRVTIREIGYFILRVTIRKIGYFILRVAIREIGYFILRVTIREIADIVFRGWHGLRRWRSSVGGLRKPGGGKPKARRVMRN
jgi:hypothetical protein